MPYQTEICGCEPHANFFENIEQFLLKYVEQCGILNLNKIGIASISLESIAGNDANKQKTQIVCENGFVNGIGKADESPLAQS